MQLKSADKSELHCWIKKNTKHTERERKHKKLHFVINNNKYLINNNKKSWILD